MTHGPSIIVIRSGHFSFLDNNLTILFHPSSRINPLSWCNQFINTSLQCPTFSTTTSSHFITLNYIHPFAYSSNPVRAVQLMSSTDLSAPPSSGGVLRPRVSHLLCPYCRRFYWKWSKKESLRRSFQGIATVISIHPIPSYPRLHVLVYSIYQPVCSNCHLFLAFYIRFALTHRWPS
jgi:hypothetical protein